MNRSRGVCASRYFYFVSTLNRHWDISILKYIKKFQFFQQKIPRFPRIREHVRSDNDVYTSDLLFRLKMRLWRDKKKFPEINRSRGVHNHRTQENVQTPKIQKVRATWKYSHLTNFLNSRSRSGKPLALLSEQRAAIGWFRDHFSDPHFGTVWQHVKKQCSRFRPNSTPGYGLIQAWFSNCRVRQVLLVAVGRIPSLRAPAAHGVSTWHCNNKRKIYPPFQSSLPSHTQYFP